MSETPCWRVSADIDILTAERDQLRERIVFLEAAVAATAGMNERATLRWWAARANDETVRVRELERDVARLREALSWLHRGVHAVEGNNCRCRAATALGRREAGLSSLAAVFLGLFVSLAMMVGISAAGSHLRQCATMFARFHAAVQQVAEGR